MGVYRQPPFILPRLGNVAVLFGSAPPVVDSPPLGRVMSAQLIAVAAYRPLARAMPPPRPNAAILDYYETDVSIGQDSFQARTWAAYRAPLMPPRQRVFNPALFGTPSASVTGTGAMSIPAVTMASTGAASHVGTGALIIPAVTLAGTGRDTTMRGTGSLSIPAVTASGSGVAAHIGSGTLATPAITMSATGNRGPAGSGSPSIPSITMSGTGIVSHKGSGTMNIPAVTMAGTGQDTTIRGTGTPSIPSVVMSGSGIASHGGAGAMSIPAITSAGLGYGSGLASPLGSGALSIPAITALGVGVQTSFALRVAQANQLLRQELQDLKNQSLNAQKTFTIEIDDLRERVRELEVRYRRGNR